MSENDRISACFLQVVVWGPCHWRMWSIAVMTKSIFPNNKSALDFLLERTGQKPSRSMQSVSALTQPAAPVLGRQVLSRLQASLQQLGF
jgi:hypothetical protein